MPWTRLRSLLGLLAVLACVAAAQPLIDAGGAVNAASYALAGLPNSSIGRGSIFNVFGRNMGPTTIELAKFPLPTTLAGTSVKVTIAGTTLNALMVYTLATQLACLMPSNTPEGTGTLQVTYNNQASPAVPVTVVRASFGILTINQAGSGPGLFTDAEYKVNTVTWSARPNEIIAAWGTGLGPVTFDETRGAPPEDMRDSDVQVFVGGKPAEVLFRGRAPNFSGLDQITFRIPPGLEGCYVPVAVKVGGAVSNFVSISISAGKRTCSDPLGLSDTEIDQAKTKDSLSIGSVALSKTEISLGAVPGLGDVSIKTDRGSADFVRYNFLKLIGSRGASGFAPFGHCAVYTFTGQAYTLSEPVNPAGLDAGNISVTGPRGTKQFTLDSKGHYSAELGGGVPGMPGWQEEYLVKGSYTVTGTGGADVKQFTATLNLPDPLQWTNRDSISAVSRSQDLRVTWSGGDPSREYVTLVGVSMRTTPEVGAAFICTERAAAQALTVPALVLSALPASQAGGSVLGMPTGMLMLGSAPLMEPSKFRATGLDVGYFYYTMLSGKSVTYQ
jgi:uncharacterized protein (TIGR03437 family)